MKINFISNTLIVLLINKINSSQLRQLFMISRHGDRTPANCFQFDPNCNDKYWPDGWAQLTNRGKDRMYSLGQYIRQRYDRFLSHSPREVHIRSAIYDRCVESAALVMAGAYKPEGRWQWNQNFGKLWQPFPIHTLPTNLDGMLNQMFICESATQESFRVFKSPEVKHYLQNKTEFLKYVSINTGIDLKDLLDLTNANTISIFDSLLVEKENNFTLPTWVNTTTYELLNEISNMVYYFNSSSKLLQRFNIGLFLKDIIIHIKNNLNKNINSNDILHKKLFIYLTHEAEIAFLLSALGVFDRERPKYGATVLIELRETNGKHLVEVYYLKSTESERPIAMVLPNCVNDKNECLFSQFVESVTDLIPNDLQQECNHIE